MTDKRKQYYCIPCEIVIRDRQLHIALVHPNYVLPGEPWRKAYKHTFLEV